MQQLALRPYGDATFGAQRDHAIVLIDQVNAACINDKVVYRAQFTFPQNLAGTQIQRSQVAIVT
ncbi:hypothetical protein D3C78_1316800 [compost metagenome]